MSLQNCVVGEKFKTPLHAISICATTLLKLASALKTHTVTTLSLYFIHVFRGLVATATLRHVNHIRLLTN